MALRQLARPVPKTALKLPASAYNPGSTGHYRYKQTHLKALAGWMAKRFKPDTFYPEYALAQAMNVHRVIADDWLSTLVQFDMVKSEVLKKPVLEMQALAFYIPKAQHASYDKTVELDFSDLTGFDPWTDTSLDGKVWMADTPELFCDKFYSINLSEMYVVEGRQRIRPNRHMFIHVDWNPIQELLAKFAPRSPALRQALDRAASGDKTMARPS